MSNLALDLTYAGKGKDSKRPLDRGNELRLLSSSSGDEYIFFRSQMFAQYQSDDHYTRNLIMVQLFLCHKVGQKELSKVFELTVPHISYLVGKYRRSGSAGIEDNIRVRINNNQKIKGKIAEYMIKQLEMNELERPSYGALEKAVKRRYGVSISRQRIGSWWREYKMGQREQGQQPIEPEQLTLNLTPEQGIQEIASDTQEAERRGSETNAQVGDAWQPNNIAGSFMLYAMLEKSQFLKPFLASRQRVAKAGAKKR